MKKIWMAMRKAEEAIPGGFFAAVNILVEGQDISTFRGNIFSVAAVVKPGGFFTTCRLIPLSPLKWTTSSNPMKDAEAQAWWEAREIRKSIAGSESATDGFDRKVNRL